MFLIQLLPVEIWVRGMGLKRRMEMAQDSGSDSQTAEEEADPPASAYFLWWGKKN